MTHLYLELGSYTVVTRDRDPSDRWSGEDTDTSWTILDICLGKPRSYSGRQIPYDFDVSVGDTVYLLYSINSEGDSFSRHDGEHFEDILVFKTLEKAQAAKKVLEGFDKSGNDQMINLTTESGEIYKFYPPWWGYFERLDTLDIETMTVK